MNYVRFIAIIASWKFALTNPEVFTVLYLVAQILGALDGSIARLLGQTSFFGS
jgi:phosphatidylglycerophosphate synthase